MLKTCLQLALLPEVFADLTDYQEATPHFETSNGDSSNEEVDELDRCRAELLLTDARCKGQ